MRIVSDSLLVESNTVVEEESRHEAKCRWGVAGVAFGDVTAVTGQTSG